VTTRYLLDTNAASAILRQQEPVCARAASVPLSALAISSVTAGEMHYGLAKRPQATTLAKLVREFLRYTDILPWSDAIAPHYGTLRAALEAKGVTVPAALSCQAGGLSMCCRSHSFGSDPASGRDSVAALRNFIAIAGVREDEVR